MDIKPIRNEADYEAALKEVENLWGVESGTPDGDRFEVLFTLVEAYEDQHYPNLPPDPIEAIKYYMESRGLDLCWLNLTIGFWSDFQIIIASPPANTRGRGQSGDRTRKYGV